jgi:hypothetical protein
MTGRITQRRNKYGRKDNAEKKDKWQKKWAIKAHRIGENLEKWGHDSKK